MPLTSKWRFGPKKGAVNNERVMKCGRL